MTSRWSHPLQWPPDHAGLAMNTADKDLAPPSIRLDPHMSGPWLIPVLPNIPGKTTCAQCEGLDRISMLKMLTARSDRSMNPLCAQKPPGLTDAIGSVASSQGTLASMHPLRIVYMRHVQRVRDLWLKQGRYLNQSRTSTNDGLRICSWTSTTHRR